MKLFSYRRAGEDSVGVVALSDGTLFFDVRELSPAAPRSLADLLAQPQQLETLRAAMRAGGAVPRHALDAVELLPVVPNPGKIVCMGLNYADHAKEGGNAVPAYPAFFLRAASSQVAHGAPLLLPKVSSQLDYEAELAVVIGRSGRHIAAARALDHVAGYSAYNDGSVRDYQRKSAQWTIGKNFDGTGAFGPWLVTADELPAGAAGLRIRSRLNGATMQDGNTQDFIWPVAQAIALLSECMTLEPGDVVITGTPAGVGYARKPPVFLRDGDVCEVEIEGIGVLRNVVRQEA